MKRRAYLGVAERPAAGGYIGLGIEGAVARDLAERKRAGTPTPGQLIAKLQFPDQSLRSKRKPSADPQSGATHPLRHGAQFHGTRQRVRLTS